MTTIYLFETDDGPDADGGVLILIRTGFEDDYQTCCKIERSRNCCWLTHNILLILDLTFKLLDDSLTYCRRCR